MRNNYRSSFKSSVFTGGSQVVSLVASVIRMKFAAVFLGVSGVGVYSMLTQMLTLTTTVADMGVSTSSTRQIAASKGKGDIRGVSESYRCTKLIFRTTGVLATVLIVLNSESLSTLVLGDSKYALHVSLVGAAVFFSQITSTYSVVLAGLGEIKKLAFRRVCMAVLGTAFIVPSYLLFGENSIGYIILCLAVGEWILAWRQSSFVKLPSVSMSSHRTYEAAKDAISNGLPMLWSSSIFLLSGYTVSIIVRHEHGIHASGLYQSAWAISGYLAGFVLSAIGQDFFPRLSSKIDEKKEAIPLINSQIEIGVLMALPGMVFFSACGDWIIPRLLSAEFGDSIHVVQILCIGVLGRIVNWPMLFALNAAKRPYRHLSAVLASALVYIILAWIGTTAWGISGAAAGFAAMHIFHMIWMRVDLGNLLDFQFTKDAIVLVVVGLLALVLCPLINPFMGLALSLALGHMSIKGICTRLGHDHVLVRKISSIPLVSVLYVPNTR